MISSQVSIWALTLALGVNGPLVRSHLMQVLIQNLAGRWAGSADKWSRITRAKQAICSGGPGTTYGPWNLFWVFNAQICIGKHATHFWWRIKSVLLSPSAIGPYVWGVLSYLGERSIHSRLSTNYLNAVIPCNVIPLYNTQCTEPPPSEQ